MKSLSFGEYFMWGKIIFGVIGTALDGPIGAGIGVAVGSFFDSDSDDDSALAINDSLDLAMTVQSDKDGIYLFVEAQKNTPSRELFAIANILESGSETYIKAKNVESIPPMFIDKDGDFSIATKFLAGSGVFFIPIGILDYPSGGIYRFAITVIDVNPNNEMTLIGREIFNGNLPPPRAWYRSEYLRPLIGLMMVISRSHGELDKKTVKKIREFIEGPLKVPEEERVVLKELIKSEPSEDISTLTLRTKYRYQDLEESDIIEILLAFSKIDECIDRISCDVLQEIAKQLGLPREILDQLDSLAKDHYSILGVHPYATPDEIRRAFRLKIKEYHPDKVATLAKEFQELAHRKTIEIRESYEYLLKQAMSSEN